MKSFKELIRELEDTDTLISIQEAVSKIKTPFLIAIKNGSDIIIKKEVMTDDKSRQEEILKDYFNVSGTWIIPSRDSQDLSLGDSISKKDLKKRSAVPLKQFTEECSCDQDSEELDEFTINEAIAVKTVRIRKGKRYVFWKCPPGHHKVKKGGKTCVRTTGQASYKKKRGAIKAARTRKGKQAAMNRQRSRSMRKRRGMGL